MSGRLVYVVGPSGAGKDSVLCETRMRLAPDAKVLFARRTITRPSHIDSEDHIPVTPGGFEALRAQGAFAMHWTAHGYAYGIRREIDPALAAGWTVVVSGSRAHLATACLSYACMEAVHITAPDALLRSRLERRERETNPDIAARLARRPAMAAPANCRLIEIINDGPLSQAADAFLRLLVGARVPAFP